MRKTPAWLLALAHIYCPLRMNGKGANLLLASVKSNTMPCYE